MKIKNIVAHFRNHFFFYLVALFVAITAIVSFYRFMIKHDYLVGYEGECDPATQECFIGCEDDVCSLEYYYSEIIKYAPDLEKECGVDITNCEAADVCLPDDQGCSVIYCDPEIDGNICANTEEETETQDSNQDALDENEPLQDNNEDKTNI